MMRMHRNAVKGNYPGMDVSHEPLLHLFLFLLFTPTLCTMSTEEARTASISRKTNETDIQVAINLDGKFDQQINVDTGIGFLDHVRPFFSPTPLTEGRERERIDTWWLDVSCSCQARRLVLDAQLQGRFAH